MGGTPQSRAADRTRGLTLLGEQLRALGVGEPERSLALERAAAEPSGAGVVQELARTLMFETMRNADRASPALSPRARQLLGERFEQILARVTVAHLERVGLPGALRGAIIEMRAGCFQFAPGAGIMPTRGPLFDFAQYAPSQAPGG